MGLIILIVLAAAIVTVLVVAASKPNTFRVQRSSTMAAAPETIFAQVEDLHKWQAWSPWERLDGGMQRDYSGADHGVGAAYGWKGNGKAGEGRMEITEVHAPGKVVIRLDFVKPFKATNTAEFTLQQSGRDGTVVTWALYGPQPFVSKIMGTLFNMDDLIGKDFEAGLNNLKAVVEPKMELESGAAAEGVAS